MVRITAALDQSWSSGDRMYANYIWSRRSDTPIIHCFFIHRTKTILFNIIFVSFHNDRMSLNYFRNSYVLFWREKKNYNKSNNDFVLIKNVFSFCLPSLNVKHVSCVQSNCNYVKHSVYGHFFFIRQLHKSINNIERQSLLLR